MIIGYIKRGTEHVRSEGNPGRRKAYEHCSLCHIRRKLRSQEEGRMPLRERQERARKRPYRRPHHRRKVCPHRKEGRLFVGAHAP